MDEERRRREEDKRVAEEKLRVSEQPYFVFKNSKAVSNSNSESTILCMEFLNEAVQDPIAMVSEAFVMVMSYDKDEKDFFRMTPTIKFEDASGRKYKQTFCIDIGDRLGNGVIINYAQPELCEE